MIIAAIAGALAGIFCGLIPGLHTNLIAGGVLLVSEDAWWWVVFLASFAVARSIVDAVPSVFLGFSDDVLALHPSQVLLKQGKGLLAVKCSIAGALLGLVLCLLVAPLLWLVFPPLSKLLKPFLFWIVLAAIIWLLVNEEKWHWAVFVFVLSGIFGLIVLDSVVEPLFPMLSGLFGASGIFLSFFSKGTIPVQQSYDSHIRPKIIVPGVVFGVLAGCLLMLVPGLGPSQGAALVGGKSFGKKGFLVATGALGTVDVMASLITVAVLGKARNGAVVAVQSLVGDVSLEMFIALAGASLFSVGFAVIVALWCAQAHSSVMARLNVRFIHLLVFSLLCIGSLTFSGPLGVLVLFIGTAIGLIAPLSGISRSHAMGCLLLPTLVYLW